MSGVAPGTGGKTCMNVTLVGNDFTGPTMTTFGMALLYTPISYCG